MTRSIEELDNGLVAPLRYQATIAKIAIRARLHDDESHSPPRVCVMLNDDRPENLANPIRLCCPRSRRFLHSDHPALRSTPIAATIPPQTLQMPHNPQRPARHTLQLHHPLLPN